VTKGTPKESSSDFTFGDGRDDIALRAKQAGIRIVLHEFDFSGPDPTRGKDRFLLLEFPGGEAPREFYVFPPDIEMWKSVRFEDWLFFGENIAFYDRSTNTIEAAVRPGTQSLQSDELVGLPGVVRSSISSDPDGLAYEMPRDFQYEISDIASGRWRPPIEQRWKLPLESGDSTVSMELSEVSASLSVITSRWRMGNPWPSLKIRGMKRSEHDNLAQILDVYSSAFFFELDLRFEIPLSLERNQRPVQFLEKGEFLKSGPPIAMPKNKYAQQATSLYFYARSAAGMPLLQFLAYYQAIEFFYPSFWHAEVIRRIRNEIKDPRFDINNDGELQRLISIATNSGRNSSSERQQLRATIDACVDEKTVKDFIETKALRRDFLSKKNALGSVPQINFRSESLIEQVASRVYAIRCRIVHSKEDGGATGSDVLLPYSAEADRLTYDIELIRFLAQKVIVAGSRGRL